MRVPVGAHSSLTLVARRGNEYDLIWSGGRRWTRQGCRRAENRLDIIRVFYRTRPRGLQRRLCRRRR